MAMDTVGVDLDAAFLDRDGRILDIQRMRAEPHSPKYGGRREYRGRGGKYAYVLEARDGFFEKAGWKVGDVLIWDGAKVWRGGTPKSAKTGLPGEPGKWLKWDNFDITPVSEALKLDISPLYNNQQWGNPKQWRQHVASRFLPIETEQNPLYRQIGIDAGAIGIRRWSPEFGGWWQNYGLDYRGQTMPFRYMNGMTVEYLFKGKDGQPNNVVLCDPFVTLLRTVDDEGTLTDVGPGEHDRTTRQYLSLSNIVSMYEGRGDGTRIINAMRRFADEHNMSFVIRLLMNEDYWKQHTEGENAWLEKRPYIVRDSAESDPYVAPYPAGLYTPKQGVMKLSNRSYTNQPGEWAVKDDYHVYPESERGMLERGSPWGRRWKSPEEWRRHEASKFKPISEERNTLYRRIGEKAGAIGIRRWSSQFGGWWQNYGIMYQGMMTPFPYYNGRTVEYLFKGHDGQAPNVVLCDPTIVPLKSENGLQTVPKVEHSGKGVQRFIRLSYIVSMYEGRGDGTRIVNAMREIADEMHLPMVVRGLVNERYWSRFIRGENAWLKKTPYRVHGKDIDPYPSGLYMLEQTLPNKETMKLSAKQSITKAQARSIGDRLKVDWSKVDPEQFRMGIEVESEHADAVGDDPVKWGEIALAHLKEIKDYYTRLDKMESGAMKLSAKKGIDTSKLVYAFAKQFNRYMRRSIPFHWDENALERASRQATLILASVFNDARDAHADDDSDTKVNLPLGESPVICFVPMVPNGQYDVDMNAIFINKKFIVNPNYLSSIYKTLSHELVHYFQSQFDREGFIRQVNRHFQNIDPADIDNWTDDRYRHHVNEPFEQQGHIQGIVYRLLQDYDIEDIEFLMQLGGAEFSYRLSEMSPEFEEVYDSSEPNMRKDLLRIIYNRLQEYIARARTNRANRTAAREGVDTTRIAEEMAEAIQEELKRLKADFERRNPPVSRTKKPKDDKDDKNLSLGLPGSSYNWPVGGRSWWGKGRDEAVPKLERFAYDLLKKYNNEGGHMKYKLRVLPIFNFKPNAPHTGRYHPQTNTLTIPMGTIEGSGFKSLLAHELAHVVQCNLHPGFGLEENEKAEGGDHNTYMNHPWEVQAWVQSTISNLPKPSGSWVFKNWKNFRKYLSKSYTFSSLENSLNEENWRYALQILYNRLHKMYGNLPEGTPDPDPIMPRYHTKRDYGIGTWQEGGIYSVPKGRWSRNDKGDWVWIEENGAQGNLPFHENKKPNEDIMEDIDQQLREWEKKRGIKPEENLGYDIVDKNIEDEIAKWREEHAKEREDDADNMDWLETGEWRSVVQEPPLVEDGIAQFWEGIIRSPSGEEGYGHIYADGDIYAFMDSGQFYVDDTTGWQWLDDSEEPHTYDESSDRYDVGDNDKGRDDFDGSEFRMLSARVRS
jgi:hypothetical protein